MNKIKRILIALFPLQNRIIFESNPEMACNTMPVFEEMIRREINKNYKFAWMVEDKSKYKDYKIRNVSFVEYNSYRTFLGRMQWQWYRATSKCIIFSNRFQSKLRKGQLVVNLMHGMPIKSAGGYKLYDTCDYVISSGHKLNQFVAKEYEFPMKKIISLGYPRTDVLGYRNDSLNKLGLLSFKNVVLWMPTFRKHKTHNECDGTNYVSGVPLLKSSKDFDRVENFCKAQNIALIIKLHPAQDVKEIKKYCSPNIIFMNDEDIINAGSTLYKLLKESSALITDYSSVYYDYLLTDNPIGLIIDDIEEYKKTRGFALPKYEDYLKGSYIYNLDDFFAFLKNVADGINPDADDLMWAKNEWLDYHDFKSTQRVVDFICDKLKCN